MYRVLRSEWAGSRRGRPPDLRNLNRHFRILTCGTCPGSWRARLIKSPKVYVADPGLACHLLGIETAAELARSPFRGPLFEGFIASEIAKAQVNAGGRREIYHFRDEQGLEVDFLVPGRRGAVTLVECKSTRTPTPAHAAPMRKLAAALAGKRGKLTAVEAFLVHEPARGGTTTQAVAPGVRAVPWPDFVAAL